MHFEISITDQMLTTLGTNTCLKFQPKIFNFARVKIKVVPIELAHPLYPIVFSLPDMAHFLLINTTNTF